MLGLGGPVILLVVFGIVGVSMIHMRDEEWATSAAVTGVNALFQWVSG